MTNGETERRSIAANIPSQPRQNHAAQITISSVSPPSFGQIGTVRSLPNAHACHQRTADAIAREAGIDEAYGDLSPDDKIARVRALLSEHGYVGNIGAGTDTAIETADMALMQDDLGKVAEAIALGQRTVGIIQFNIAFALALKAVFLVLALLGHASLWLAILADTGAALLVILNALRLLRG